MKHIIHVNQHVIRRNTKTGEREPVLTVKTYKDNQYGHSVKISGPCVIPNERIDVLPDTQTCVQCSGVEKYVGAMIFDHKTAGRLEYVNPKNKQAVETLKRFVNRARN